MICKDDAAVVEKLCGLGDKFRELYRQKEYARAMFAYYEAFTVAVFMEADDGLIKYLFGYGNAEDEDVRGLFDRDMVHKALPECWRRHESPPYVYLDKEDMLKALGEK